MCGVSSTPSGVILTPLVVILTLFGVMFKLYIGCNFNTWGCGPLLTPTGVIVTPQFLQCSKQRKRSALIVTQTELEISIEERKKYQYCVLVFKIQNNLTPTYLESLICKQTVNYRTRYSTKCPLQATPTQGQNMKETHLAYVGASLFEYSDVYIIYMP